MTTNCNHNRNHKSAPCSIDGTPLSLDYQPGPLAIICGRGRGYYNCPGNIVFRATVKTFCAYYLQQTHKSSKTGVLEEIVRYCRTQKGMQFVKYSSGGVWYELSDLAAREKVGNAMREAIAAHHAEQQQQQQQQHQVEQPEQQQSTAATPKTTTTTTPTTPKMPPQIPSQQPLSQSSPSGRFEVFGRKIALVRTSLLRHREHSLFVDQPQQQHHNNNNKSNSCHNQRSTTTTPTSKYSSLKRSQSDPCTTSRSSMAMSLTSTEGEWLEQMILMEDDFDYPQSAQPQPQPHQRPQQVVRWSFTSSCRNGSGSGEMSLSSSVMSVAGSSLDNCSVTMAV